ncbi:efflux transporter periplasmic adaptor subunit [Aliidiomarina iranensis]|uniref:Efflux transporter periplasmic adaptor subunit n=1 Tax=Aliidiomarina iranensis TaxID=1434071 RepID=A0A432VZV9_9GAMM|nr:efflux RND transporter periplasmic adaptor subunit [Aliidiomarina iranensis]RUO22275.1 efflux transporter periplasmic adaptor subunit [Aliidiomarina iranensis]
MKAVANSAATNQRFYTSLRGFIGVSAIALLVACSDDPQGGAGMGGGMGGDMPPSPVTVSEISLQSVTHQVTYPGRIRGKSEVEVRAQVAGILLERNYSEGDYVEKGQTLFQIDPEPFVLALNSAEAALETAQANQAQAENEWERVADLYENNAASTREFDQARANIASANARLAQAEADLKDAERNLRYTRVEAPINGIAGIEAVSPGNLISSGGYLTHMVQTDNVYVHFAIPEKDGEIYRASLRQANGDIARARIQFANDEYYSETGTVNYVNTSVNPATARVELRAEFPNQEQVLRSGQFVRVRITLQEFSSVALVDSSVVSQGPQGAQVFVVNNENSAEAKAVELGPIVDGQQVILNGLDNGDMLVINGHVALADGAPVNVTNGN